MEDIFLNDPRQSSAQNIARNQKNAKAPKRRFREYLVDLLVKSLLLTAFVALDFTLFAEAGSYNLFTADQSLVFEAAWIYCAIAMVSFALIFILSFSLTLQNFAVSVGAGGLLLAILNQFANFDPHSILSAYLPSFASDTFGNIMTEYSHYVLAASVFIAVFLFLTFARRSNQMYFLGTILLICGGLLSEAYFNPLSRYFDTKPALDDETTYANGRNFIFIALPDSPSYYKLQALNEGGKNHDIKQAADNLLGFYMQNNFTYYPNAYIEQSNQPLMNLANSLNPNQTKADDILLSDVLLDGYWNFKHLGNERIYLRANRVFDTFHKNDYNIRVYQNHGIELCSINNRLSVNRCVEKVGLPVSLKNLHLTTAQKVALLASEWIESTGIIPSINPILGLTSAIEREIAPLHFATSQLAALDSFKTLDLIADDIVSDKGNNAYFAVLNLPGDLFIYDSLCNLKPLSRWVSADDKDTALMVRRASFAEQTDCLYGKLENFMQTLQKNNRLKNTVVMIQGLNPPFPNIPGLDKDIYKSLQNNRQAGMAIYDPLKNQADIDYKLCTAPAILRSYLYKKDCHELEDFSITNQLRQDILQSAAAQKIANAKIEKARAQFKIWYENWANHNQVSNLIGKEIIPLEKLPDEPEIVPEKEIKEVPIAEKVEENAPETKPQTLSEAAREQAAAPKTEPLPKPEQLKKELKAKTQKTTPTTPSAKKGSQVSVAVKVIDNTANDTVPPAVSNDLQPRKAKK